MLRLLSINSAHVENNDRRNTDKERYYPGNMQPTTLSFDYIFGESVNYFQLF